MTDPIVQVMHQTVREFFLRSNGFVTNSTYRMGEDDAHRMIITTCIKYLTFCAKYTPTGSAELPQVETWNSEYIQSYTQYLKERPLINYALGYLKDHISKYSETTDISSLISGLVKDLTAPTTGCYLFENWITVHLGHTIPGGRKCSIAENFRNETLWCACEAGYSNVAGALLIAGAHVETSQRGVTPLIISASKGHEAAVRLLLDHDANIEASDSTQCTALHWASTNGHKSTVQLLLDRGANVEVQDSKRCTALH